MKMYRVVPQTKRENSSMRGHCYLLPGFIKQYIFIDTVCYYHALWYNSL